MLFLFHFYVVIFHFYSLHPYGGDDDDDGGDGDIEMGTDDSASDDDLLPQFDGASDKLSGTAGA